MSNTPMRDSMEAAQQRALETRVARRDALRAMTIAQLAGEIRRDWTRPYFGAVPYLEAASTMLSIDSAYGADSGRTIVAYLISNLSTWRGPVAREVKAELRRRLESR